MSDAGPEEAELDFDWSWTKSEDDWIPPTVDVSRPSVARMYDYLLGGKDNVAIDREAAARIVTLFPDARHIAGANRAFLVRAVRTMAGAGIRQFIDLGAGIPTSPNVHEVARETCPDARVVYVDNDPIVMAHNRARQVASCGVLTVQEDLRQPGAVLDNPQVRSLIDFNEPVGVLFVAVLHFVRHDLSTGILARYHKAMAAGSHLAISTFCTDGLSQQRIEEVEQVYLSANANAPMTFRSGAQVEQLFEGFEILPPGLVDVAQWRAEGERGSALVLAGVGRKG